MPIVTKRVAERLSKQLVYFQRILNKAKDRDVNESDTVIIITDMLAQMFGFDKYNEVTSETTIRGTFCDLAVKLEGTIKYLIEVKAIGLTLRENHLRQAVNYGANQGIPWVVLTNGVDWEIYQIKFDRPIGHEHICSMNMLEMNPTKNDDIERLYLLCREGIIKEAIEEYYTHSQIVNRFILAAVIQSESILSVIRRELKRLDPNSNVTFEEIKSLLPDVLKRDAVEGDSAKQAERRIKISSQKSLRKRRNNTSMESDVEDVDDEGTTIEEETT